MEVDVTPPKDAARLDLRHADQAMAHDIDADDFDDPLACPAFAEDIMDALFHSEASTSSPVSEYHAARKSHC